MDTSIFKLVGVFEENVRAGYDVDFINRIKKHGIQRVINDRISLKYIGTNYAKNYIVASRKVFNYSLSGWKTKGDYKPFANDCFFIHNIIIFHRAKFIHRTKSILYYYTRILYPIY